MAVHDPQRRVLAYCYASLALRPTHARMTGREFARFSEGLVFWCPSCNAAHAAPREALQLEPPRERPTAPRLSARRSG